jgi:hypothetical protein
VERRREWRPGDGGGGQSLGGQDGDSPITPCCPMNQRADSSGSCTRDVVRKEGGAVIRDGANALSSTWASEAYTRLGSEYQERV